MKVYADANNSYWIWNNFFIVKGVQNMFYFIFNSNDKWAKHYLIDTEFLYISLCSSVISITLAEMDPSSIYTTSSLIVLVGYWETFKNGNRVFDDNHETKLFSFYYDEIKKI